MKAVETTFAALFQTEGNQWHYHIPKFQREYTWGKSNWSKLIEDIYENDPGHYMGSVICVNDHAELGPLDELISELVDGQQRFTTVSLLLMAIYKKYKFILPIEDEDLLGDEDYKETLTSIRKKLIKRNKILPAGKIPFGGYKDNGHVYFLRVQPSSQFNNLEDYRYILSELELIGKVDRPKNCGNRLIYKTYIYFVNQIPEDRKGLDELIDRINRLSFIHISEASQSKAFTLFETLNYRGVPLTAIDIIKNKMLSTMERKHNVNIDLSFEKWQELLKNLPSHEDQDRFLRQFYNAFKHTAKIKVDKVPKATSSTLIKIYESLIHKNAQWIFNELIEKAEIYNQLIEPEEYKETPLVRALVDLSRISASAAYTFLLYLFSLDEEQLESKDLKLKVVNLFCKYYFRRNVTDFPNTRDIDAINIDLIEKCAHSLAKHEVLTYEAIESWLLKGRGKPSNLETLVEYLSDNLYYSNEGMARYVLAKLDETAHTREYKPELWERNEKGIFVWTVEHVFPQGKNIPKEWVKMIANGNVEKASEIQDEWVHCIGNLTLSGYNSKLSNYSFDKKQAKAEANIFGKKLKIGYQNGLAINNIEFEVGKRSYSLATTPSWTAQLIKARNDRMVELLAKLFSFKGERYIPTP
ncbi:MAG: DUF262 domain-containing HNH endonuclease family protein [Bacteroidetes bacterium]|nr:DUF262 domain-containing HNH endonuclease family protein [Bacteroidota bacterium]